MALLIPSGLHAKQLVDFCMSEPSATEMAANHSCCQSEQSQDKDKSESDNHQHHDCGWSFICACHIGESALSDSDWRISLTNIETHLPETGNLTPFVDRTKRIPDSNNKLLAQHDPPLWLVYDTLLN